MINTDGLRILLEYDRYANDLVLIEMARLSEAEFVQQISPSHDSVRDLFVHILLVLAGYLGYCQPQSSKPPALQTFAEVRDYSHRMGDEAQSYIASISEADLAQNLEITLGGRQFRFSIWQLLLQPLIHAIHHRGELSIVMTELGHPLPTLDIIIPFAEQSRQQWPWK